MSIIYEALKKAEKGINTGTDEKPQMAGQGKDRKSRVKLYILYFLVAFLGLVVGNAVFGFLPNPGKPQRTQVKPLPMSLSTSPEVLPPKPLAQETATLTNKPQGAFTLNGIFFSEGEGYALINNKIVKVGDEVSGAIVKKIDLGVVELETSGTTTKLYTQTGNY